MKDWQDFVWQLLIGLVIIFFGGWILGSLLNLVAMASPQLVSIIFCPAGSTATQNPAFDQPSQNGLKISCHDRSGASVPTLTDAESIALQRKYFYTPSNIIMIILVVGRFIRSSIRGMRKNQAT